MLVELLVSELHFCNNKIIVILFILLLHYISLTAFFSRTTW